MDLSAHVETLRDALRTASAAGGDQARETARLLAETMDPAVRLVLLDALSAMADEVTAALDGDVVEIRVRGREPEVVVVRATHEPAAEAPSGDPSDDSVE